MVDYIRAECTVVGTAPYSQSKKHYEDWLEGESDDAYEKRTWRSKMSVETLPSGKESVVIPAFGLQLSIVGGAQYMKKKIEGLGNATWTDKFRSGTSVMAPGGVLNIDPASVTSVAIFCNADGKRGGGRRVMRLFPQIPAGWEASFEVIVLDPIVTQDIFTEVLESAGLFRGVGQFRPENGGSNGRFAIKSIEWHDNRRKVPPAHVIERPVKPAPRAGNGRPSAH